MSGAAQLDDTYRRVDRAELVSQLARLAGGLDLEITERVRTLIDRPRDTLPVSGAPGVNVVFTAAEERAYNAIVDRINAMWSLGSGSERYIY